MLYFFILYLSYIVGTMLPISARIRPFQDKCIAAIRSHPVITFFALTLAIRWGVPVIFGLLNIKPDVDVQPVGSLLFALKTTGYYIVVFSPAFAAMIVSRFIDDRPTGVPFRKRLTVFLGIFVGAGIILLVLLRPCITCNIQVLSVNYSGFLFGGTWNLTLADVITSVILSAVVALIFSGIFSRYRGIRDLLLPILQWQTGVRWYLVALFLYPLMGIIALCLLTLAGGGSFAEWMGRVLLLIFVSAPVGSFLSNLFAASLSEEPGWRGLATPQLLLSYSPLVTGIIVGIVWAPWHYSIGEILTGSFPIRYTLSTIAQGIIFTWLYINTGRSLLPVVVLHASLDAIWDILFESNHEGSQYYLLIIYIVTCCIVLLGRLWERQPQPGQQTQVPEATPTTRERAKAADNVRLIKWSAIIGIILLCCVLGNVICNDPGSREYIRVDPATFSNVTQIAGSYAFEDHHALALFGNGTVIAWGGNKTGQCNVPPGLDHVRAVAAGDKYSLALREDGTVVAWEEAARIPPEANQCVALAAGLHHVLALTRNGTVIAWGDNKYGQTEVPKNLSHVVQVAAGVHYSLALKEDGTVVVWGRLKDSGDLVNCTAPVKAVIGGGNFALAILKNDTVLARGWNEYGQCSLPPDLWVIKKCSCGGGYALALIANGSVIAWGHNAAGQCEVPPGLTNIKEIAATDLESYAILTNGTVIHWGICKALRYGVKGTWNY